MRKVIGYFAQTGKTWLGLWSACFLVLCVYSVLCEKPVGEGAVACFVAVLGAYATNKTLESLADKKSTKGSVDEPQE